MISTLQRSVRIRGKTFSPRGFAAGTRSALIYEDEGRRISSEYIGGCIEKP